MGSAPGSKNAGKRLCLWSCRGVNPDLQYNWRGRGGIPGVFPRDCRSQSWPNHICVAKPMVGSPVCGLSCHGWRSTVSKHSEGKATILKAPGGLGQKAQEADPCSSKHGEWGSRKQPHCRNFKAPLVISLAGCSAKLTQWGKGLGRKNPTAAGPLMEDPRVWRFLTVQIPKSALTPREDLGVA
jgi:hypothetical protein